MKSKLPLLLAMILLASGCATTEHGKIGISNSTSKFRPTALGPVPVDATTTQFDAIKAKADKGDPEAQWSLGRMYANGHGVAQDNVEAIKWYRKAADQGDAFDQFDLGCMYETGQGVETNYSEALKWFLKAAAQGFPGGQFCLGDMYYDGKGVPQDYAEAAQWYREAAMRGHPYAEYKFAQMCAQGKGVPQNYVDAYTWYSLAAARGVTNIFGTQKLPDWAVSMGMTNDAVQDRDNLVKSMTTEQIASAQFRLGSAYYNGYGDEKNIMKAADWYRRAADQGNISAQYNLGVLYFNGNDLPQNYSEAAKWFEKAADQGYAAAQYGLGEIFLRDGRPEDATGAANWFLKAAEQGDSQSEETLGACYADGDGVPKNYVEAYKWISLASSSGNRLAYYWLAELEAKMTPEQIAEAQQLASEFKPEQESNSNNSVSPENPTVTGTGFFITDDGYLITNNHVVKNATNVRLLTSAGTIDAKVVSVDAANDLALLKAEGEFSSLPIAASHTASLGSTVATIGFPDPTLQGFSPKLAKGEIASLSGAADDPRYFQISVPVQPGNSGGALVDEQGNVIGIVSAKLDESAALAASGALPENVNYAIKSSFLLSFLESVPDVSAKLKVPNTTDEKFENVVKSAQDATVLVLVY